MNPAYDRGIILMANKRYDLAEREFRRALVESLSFGNAHAWLALCLVLQKKLPKEALQIADEAVRLDPETAFCHNVRGHALAANQRPDEAEAAARHAMSLEPSEAYHFALLASIEIGRQRWPQARATAEQGLAIEPLNSTLANLHAMAVRHLPNRTETDRAVTNALALGPESALAHATRGWTCLDRGDSKAAHQHFLDALRNDPNLEWARIGLERASVARRPLGGWLLVFSSPFAWLRRHLDRPRRSQ